MKKYLLSIIALGILSSAAFAEFERPRMKRDLATILERIQGILDDDEARSELSDRRIAYLEQRRDLLGVQLEMRTASRAALSELADDATEEERKAAVQSVREQFAEDLEGIKQARRDFMKRRRANRDSGEG